MNPDSIRALLDGITAGEWAAVPAKPSHPDTYYWNIRSSPETLYSLAIGMLPSDAEFIAAAPDIARYALELAAENERLKQILADVREIERKAALVLAQEAVYARTDKALTPNAPVAILEASKLMVDIEIACMALGLPLKAALAPQPAPTDGEAVE